MKKTRYVRNHPFVVYRTIEGGSITSNNGPCGGVEQPELNEKVPNHSLILAIIIISQTIHRTRDTICASASSASFTDL